MFHAANELDDDEINVLDVEEIILTGSIIARQRDQQTHERKYVIRGATLAREAACCVVKIGSCRLIWRRLIITGPGLGAELKSPRSSTA